MIRAFFALLVSAGVVCADHCAAPVRVVQHAAPYVAPVYHAPQYVPVQISPDYYYSTTNYYQMHLQADATAARTAQLILSALQQRVEVAPQVAPIIQAPPATPKVGTPVNPALANLIAARCLKCHSGADAKGGVDFSNLSTTSKAIRRKATSLACLGEMPPTGPELTHEEIALLKAWMKAVE